MAMEAVIYQKDPFLYGCKEYNYSTGVAAGDYGFGQNGENLDSINGCNWDHSPPNSSSVAQNTTSSPETCAGDGVFAGVSVVPVAATRRKRRRTKRMKNKEEMENQRMTHIAVERNRRRQMNDYLAVLRSLMPPSYAQRGDQASIVGGAINFVKELEQLLQFLEAHKLTKQEQQEQEQEAINTNIFSDFFTFPQYSTRPRINSPAALDTAVERRSSVADIEVTMVESHANIKILLKRRPKQLLKIVAGFQSVCLTILHLNITTVQEAALYCFSVKVEDECQLTTVNEIATAVHDMVGIIQGESRSG